MVNDEEFARPEHLVADHERANGIITRTSAGVADHVSVTLSQRRLGSEPLPIFAVCRKHFRGFAPFADDTSTSRDTAFAKIRSRVEGTAMAAHALGLKLAGCA